MASSRASLLFFCLSVLSLSGCLTLALAVEVGVDPLDLKLEQQQQQRSSEENGGASSSLSFLQTHTQTQTRAKKTVRVHRGERGGLTPAPLASLPTTDGKECTPGETCRIFLKQGSSCASAASPCELQIGSEVASGGVELASGRFEDSLKSTGWSNLYMKISSDQSKSLKGSGIGSPASLQAYAAGVLEGYMTANRVGQFKVITDSLLTARGSTLSAIRQHSLESVGFVEREAKMQVSSEVEGGKGDRVPGWVVSDPSSSSRTSDEAWIQQSKYLLMQTVGIRDGANLRPEEVNAPLSLVDVLFLNADGQMPEFEQAYAPNLEALRTSHTADRDSKDGGSGGDFTDAFASASSDGGIDLDLVFTGSNKRSSHSHDHSSSTQSRQKETEKIDPETSFLQYQNEERQQQKDREGRRKNKESLSSLSAVIEDLRKGSVLDESLQVEEVRAKHDQMITKQGRCSALVRLSDGKKDLLVGHTTWEPYSEMNRIFKAYDFDLPGAASKQILFSSYPGCVTSTDDWYVTDSKLAVTETTLPVVNDAAFLDIPPASEHVPDFIRIMAATRLAGSAEEWAGIFSGEEKGGKFSRNSGMYNSHWMVVDYKKFTPGEDLETGGFWTVEQGPGVLVKRDETAKLNEQGYWASFNHALFDVVGAKNGDREAALLHAQKFADAGEPNPYDLTQNLRGVLFKDEAPTVESLGDMKRVMRENKSGGVFDREKAIAARYDEGSSPSGGTDSKVVNFCLIQSLSCDAVSGPENDSEHPAWKFDDSIQDPDQRPGVPEGPYNFPWRRMSTEAISTDSVQVASPECSSSS
uniref:Phospholipase B-like n=1 Tax=Chromera velia CCMP2878 TaxID=1169474 RepID=A0A0G4IAZ2_9ALVE|eukprot:Cvel_2130.t1-p1 / transcript=Cvel_2130.t1 / gene=Cvel_2130 / organism=Chromera_velia_CCMP2878 / gene_product=Phospholipase B-like protein A, putative / transcript_product=Phospholipase B-like protein A, putative / location=Cvel_scaffold82:91542-98401(+) / protein_length=809 / sequence_SO=supercontig / SO=protein_coding / is_pseudo=false